MSMRHHQSSALLTLALLSGSCSMKQRDPSSVGLWVDVPQAATLGANSRSLQDGLARDRDWQSAFVTAPGNVDDFQCYGINVMGPGLSRFQMSPLPAGTSPDVCNYAGVTSSLVGTNGSSIQLQVPPGPARTIQMIGIRSDVPCKLGMDLKQFEEQVNQQIPNPTNSAPPILLQEIGRTTVDLFSDASVEINSNFDQHKGYPFGCASIVAPVNLDLPLYGAWGGASSASTFAGTAVPPTTSTDAFYSASNATWGTSTFTSLTVANLLGLSNFSSNIEFHPFALNSGDHGRWDLAFQVPSGTQVSNYKQLIINVRAAGGTDFSCGGSTITGNFGVSFRALNGSNWDANGAQNPVATAPGPVMAYSYGSNLAPYVRTYSFAGTFTDLVIVQVRADFAAPGSYCSKAMLYSASAKLTP